MNYSRMDTLLAEEEANVVSSYKPETIEIETEITKDDQLQSFREKLGLETTEVIELPNVENEDILPSQTTLQERFVREYTVNETATTSKSKLSTKQKMAVASYVAIVAVLILAVTLCSLAINGTFASILSLNQVENGLAEEIGVLEGILGEDNYDELYQKALEEGYVEMGKDNTMYYDSLPTRPSQSTNIESNWFDKLCDWLSSIFGG